MDKKLVIGLMIVAVFVSILVIAGCQTASTPASSSNSMGITNVSPYALGD